jgi:hypothetical protein
MTTQARAWLVVGIAGTFCGVIAGLQQRVTPGAVIAISAVAVSAAIIVARILPRHADPW